PGALILAENDLLAFAARQLHRDDLIFESTAGNGGQGPLIGFEGISVLIFSRYTISFTAKLVGNAHVEIIYYVPQAVMNHVVHYGPVAHPVAGPCFFQIVWSHAHVFHSPCNYDISIAQLDSLSGEHHRLQARTADLVHRDGFHLPRHAGGNCSLFSRILPIAAWEHHTHYDFIYLIFAYSCALNSFFDYDTTQLGAPDGTERSIEAPQRGPNGANDYGFSHSNLLILKKAEFLNAIRSLDRLAERSAEKPGVKETMN